MRAPAEQVRVAVWAVGPRTDRRAQLSATSERRGHRYFRASNPTDGDTQLTNANPFGAHGALLSDNLRVDVLVLHHASSNMLDLMDASRCEHSLQNEELLVAATQWRGEASNALNDVFTRWDEKRAALHAVIGNLGSAMADAALSYVSTDQTATNAIKKSTESI